MNAIGPTYEQSIKDNAARLKNVFFPVVKTPLRADIVALTGADNSRQKALDELIRKYTWSDVKNTGDQDITAKEIVSVVASKHGVTEPEIYSARRYKRIVHARQEIMYEIAKRKGWSLPRIGSFLGGRDHTTVLHGIRRHSRILEELAKEELTQ